MNEEEYYNLTLLYNDFNYYYEYNINDRKEDENDD